MLPDHVAIAVQARPSSRSTVHSLLMSRATCHRCRKPQALCLCARMPQVDNRTPLVILQHKRERFHSVGTARIARLALSRCQVREVSRPIAQAPLPAGAAVLYPADGAPDLAELSPQEHPSCLVVLDGTWHHARRMYLDTPWLRRLPAVRLSPDAPSRYRIRRQAQRHHISTIESIVAALNILEPDTPGVGQLLDVFDSMVTDQEAFMLNPDGEPRRQRRRARPSRAVPSSFFEQSERLLLVYGETAPLLAHTPGAGRQLISWTALRVATGETFERFVLPQGSPAGPCQLQHMGLTDDDLAAARPLDAVAQDWARFRRPDDLLCAWNAGRLRMLRSLDSTAGQALQLKALWCNTTQKKSGSLDELVAALGLAAVPAPVKGRAAMRLSQAAAVAQHLLAMGPKIARLPKTACQPAAPAR